MLIRPTAPQTDTPLVREQANRSENTMLEDLYAMAAEPKGSIPASPLPLARAVTLYPIDLGLTPQQEAVKPAAVGSTASALVQEQVMSTPSQLWDKRSEQIRKLTDKMTAFLAEVGYLPKDIRFMRDPKTGKLQSLTRWQRLIAYFKPSRYPTDNIRQELYGHIEQIYGTYTARKHANQLKDMALTPANIKSLITTIENTLFNFEAIGSFGGKARALYNNALQMIVAQANDKNHLREVSLSLMHSHTQNEEALVWTPETLHVYVDPQLQTDIFRQNYIIGNTKLERREEPGENIHDTELRLTKQFIESLRQAPFNATSEEITVLSCLVNQASAADVCALYALGNNVDPSLNFPRIPAADRAETHHQIQKEADGKYRLVTTYENYNPQKLASPLPNTLYQYRDLPPEGNSKREDILRTTVSIDFYMEGGRPIVKLADAGIQYHLHLNSKGAWVEL